MLPTAPGQFDDPFFMRVLAGFGPVLTAANLDLLVTATQPSAPEMRAYQHFVESRRVDGVLLARTRRRNPRIAYLLDHAMPFVAHGSTSERRPFAHVTR